MPARVAEWISYSISAQTGELRTRNSLVVAVSPNSAVVRCAVDAMPVKSLLGKPRQSTVLIKAGNIFD